MKKNFLLWLVLCLPLGMLAQQQEVVLAFQAKVSELHSQYTSDGFVTYKGADLPMERNTEFPIWVDLHEGRWYQFYVVGDPEATKFEIKLAKEDIGNIITDKFKNEKTNEYWTHFSFICPRNGRYLFTFFQRGPRKNLLGHVAILQRPLRSEDGRLINYSLK